MYAKRKLQAVTALDGQERVSDLVLSLSTKQEIDPIVTILQEDMRRPVRIYPTVTRYCTWCPPCRGLGVGAVISVNLP